MHLVPAGLPPGIPGIYEDMDGTMQQAPQLVLQFNLLLLIIIRSQYPEFCPAIKEMSHLLLIFIRQITDITFCQPGSQWQERI